MAREDFRPEAHGDEDGGIVVWGTHNPINARRLTVAHLAECGFVPGETEWPEGFNKLESYESASRYWTTEPDVNDETAVYETKKDWFYGAIPWMYVEVAYE